MLNLVAIIKKDGKDTGVRTNYRGALYVDKKVYYKRKDVAALFKALKKAVVVKKSKGESTSD